MTDRTAEASQLIAARAAGFTLLLIIVTGIFGNFFVRAALVVPEDTAATINNIATNEQLFRIGIASEIVMFTADVLLAVALYVLLKPVGQYLALLGAFWRLANATLSGFVLLNHFLVLQLVGKPEYLAAFGEDQLHALVELFLSAHGSGNLIGLIFFSLGAGIHSFLLFKSRYIPRVFSALYVFASVELFLICFSILLFPKVLDAISPAFLLPIFLAELSVSTWLLFRGVNLRSD